MINVYKCRFEFVKQSRVFTENVFIVSHSPEGCEQFILDALKIRELKYKEFVPIAQISGFSEIICKQITQQNYKHHQQSLEYAKGLDGSNFPTQQSVEDYRRIKDNTHYRYDINNTQHQPDLGKPNVHIDPKTEVKPVSDAELMKRYGVWGVV